MALAFLAGCASPSAPRPEEVKVRQFAGQGYLTDDHFGIATSFANWTTGDHSFDVALTLPTKPGQLPLVIYLPALGETRTSGETWRTAWAQGGYAVLSLQALGDDARAWSSSLARSGDFAILARDRYSARVMEARLEALKIALTELKRRSARKDAGMERLDLSQVAIAGYDLGAYAAMVIAGENIKGMPPVSLPLPITAVIALSPYADFSGASFLDRYAGIRGPVLSITGDNDSDALGLVPSSSVRKAPFEYMPGGNKYLLTMSGISHAALGGMPEKMDAAEEHRPLINAANPDGMRQQGGGQTGGRNKGGSRSGRESPVVDRGKRPEEALSPFRSVQSMTSQAMSLAAIQGVTTAFLDAYVKHDAIAREWLEKDAPRWLRDKGEIKRK